jgi:dTDP-glucose pyrophosphorylase
MKAVIMAAGRGTRLKPLTDTTPKSLVEINGRPFLAYIFDNLKRVGITDIGLVVNYLGEQFVPFLEDYGLNARVMTQTLPPGTGNAVITARRFTEDDDFLVLGGDNLWSPFDIEKVARDDGYNHIAGIQVDEPQKYGVLVTGKDGSLERIVEKPPLFVGDLINTGLYRFGPEIYAELDRTSISSRGEIELTDAMTSLAIRGRMKVVKIRDYWLDLGCLEDVAKVEKYLLGLQKN